MNLKRYSFFPFFLLTTIYLTQQANAGVLKSLDEELAALVASTEPYLVTVKGSDAHRNLIATGVVYGSDGYILTSSQICQAINFEVTFRNGSTFPATLVGTDNFSGLGIIRLGGKKLTPPPWGIASRLGDGAWVMVVGNSYGVPATINFGSLEGRTPEGLLRISVDASPGSSGGAVLNMNGDVVAILVARDGSYRYSAAAQENAAIEKSSSPVKLLDSFSVPAYGNCYAIPIEMVQLIAPQIIRNGKVSRGFLGIMPQALSANEMNKRKLINGLLVAEIDSGSPAEKAGIQKGDIITAINGRPVADRAALYTSIRSRQPGDSVTLTCFRQDKPANTVAILGEAGNDLFMGGMELSRMMPNLTESRKLGPLGSADLSQEVVELKSQVAKLQKELNQLRNEMKK